MKWAMKEKREALCETIVEASPARLQNRITEAIARQQSSDSSHVMFLHADIVALIRWPFADEHHNWRLP